MVSLKDIQYRGGGVGGGGGGLSRSHKAVAKSASLLPRRAE